MTTAAIVLAGGSGSRIHPEENKAYLEIAGRTVLSYSLDSMQQAGAVDVVVLVVRPVDRARATEVVARHEITKLIAIVDGGATRQESEMAGIGVLADRIEAGEIDFVAVHDGARPFASLSLITAVLEAAQTHGGAIPALPVEESLYVSTAGRAEPVEAATLVRVQTPQAFAAAPLLAAYRAAAAAGFSGFDTAETIEKFSSISVKTVAGDPRNIKLTFVEDLAEAEVLAMSWQSGEWT